MLWVIDCGIQTTGCRVLSKNPINLIRFGALYCLDHKACLCELERECIGGGPRFFMSSYLDLRPHPPSPLTLQRWAVAAKKKLRLERKKGDAKVAGAREVGAKSEVKKRIKTVPYISLILFF